MPLNPDGQAGLTGKLEIATSTGREPPPSSFHVSAPHEMFMPSMVLHHNIPSLRHSCETPHLSGRKRASRELACCFT
ncbi:hypothetical protein MGG_15326 [Pyricularia oryzae 70-15]|uniref:Uncharacterized protein n=2 Tax=Pyricularia oryzae TaxID=318829 RepID=G4MVS5_PYRO7|nr:uncharacterized protein MGG_15326 [Pyricularia oryzae 70-15]EHA54991.1 hypothetical protein MGG_15326 [Pyricularia oryzae 70-15]QBZ56637.1 hypothetical protein PoMZ_01547 [Pyricularia oryzae]